MEKYDWNFKTQENPRRWFFIELYKENEEKKGKGGMNVAHLLVNYELDLWSSEQNL